MNDKYEKFIKDIAEYYSAKIKEHGATPAGVDWNSRSSQSLRFSQLCKIINSPENFSINELGCGYGALYTFLSEQYKLFTYNGYDISNEMIESAKKTHLIKSNISFVNSNIPSKNADYGLASGIFNIRQNIHDDEWLPFILETLDIINSTSNKGFSFNCLTKYSDSDKTKDYLYYADPLFIFDYCKQNYSHNIALLHDYDLYEFTILVRK